MRWFRLFARRKKFAAAFSAVVCCLTILTPGADDACAMKVSYSNEDSSDSYDASDREETHELYDANESYDIRGTYGIYDNASGVYRGEVYNTFRRIRYCPDIFVSEEDRIGTPLPKRTGWQMSRGEWIFREDDGDLFTGWKESDGERYYFDEEGRMETGWLELSGRFYFFEATGKLAVDRWVGNRYVGSDGAWLTSVKAGPPDVWRLQVAGILQYPELPNGCEVTCLTMLLNHAGFDVSKTELAQNYLEKGRIGNVSPNDAFLGDPAKENTLYCYSPVIVACAGKYLKSVRESGYKVVELTGAEPEKLLEEVAAGNPVQVWVTMGLGSPIYGDGWVINGIYYEKNRNLHCMVLTGYDRKKDLVYVADPMEGERTYSLSTFIKRYEQIGRQAVVIRPPKSDRKAAGGV